MAGYHNVGLFLNPEVVLKIHVHELDAIDYKAMFETTSSKVTQKCKKSYNSKKRNLAAATGKLTDQK